MNVQYSSVIASILQHIAEHIAQSQYIVVSMQ